MTHRNEKLISSKALTAAVYGHDTKVYQVLRTSQAWLTNIEIAQATGMAERTARKHTSKLQQLGLLDQVNTYPSHQFKLRDPALLDENTPAWHAWFELDMAVTKAERRGRK